MLESLPSSRMLNSLGAMACAGMMGFALYAQHGLGLEPCPLCVFQRVAVVALGVVFAAAALHDAGAAGRNVYTGLVLVAGLAGMGVAGRHVWLQSLPPDQVPACGPGLDFMMEAFPMLDMLTMVLSGSGECADVAWSLAGLTMPMWVFVCCAGLTVLGILANRAARR